MADAPRASSTRRTGARASSRFALSTKLATAPTTTPPNALLSSYRSSSRAGGLLATVPARPSGMISRCPRSPSSTCRRASSSLSLFSTVSPPISDRFLTRPRDMSSPALSITPTTCGESTSLKKRPNTTTNSSGNASAQNSACLSAQDHLHVRQGEVVDNQRDGWSLLPRGRDRLGEVRLVPQPAPRQRQEHVLKGWRG